MEKKQKRKKVYLWLLILFSICALIPLAVLSKYNHQSGDDYGYAYRTFQIWRETHSFWNVIKEAFATSAEFYQKWQGLYASAVLLALEPGVFGDKYYALTGILMLGIIVGSNCVSALYIFHHKCKCSRLESLAAGCVISFLMIEWMPSALQGLYWYNGAMNYIFFHAVLLLLVCVLVSLAECDLHKKIAKTVLAVVLVVILAGGNHVTAFMGILLIVAFGIFCAVMKRWQNLICCAITFVAMMAGFIFNVTSPGTKIRQSYFTETPGVIGTIWSAVKTGIACINNWMGLAVIVVAVLLFPIVISVVKNIREQYGFEFRYPLLVFVMSVAFLCAMFCPPIYAMGFQGDVRLTNVVYFAFVWLFVINEIYLCGWVVTKLESQEAGGQLKTAGELSNSFVLVIITLVVGMLFGCGENMTGYQAYLLVRSGEAQEYSKEADERYALLCGSAGEDVVLKAYTVKPWMLFLDDITEEKDDWRNEYMRVYFGLNSVVLEETE